MFCSGVCVATWPLYATKLVACALRRNIHFAPGSYAQEEANDGNEEGHNTLKNEEPSPSTDTSNIAETMEDTRSDETSKGSREDISSVQNSDSRRDFLARVEH
jgi:hypothetical protein